MGGAIERPLDFVASKDHYNFTVELIIKIEK